MESQTIERALCSAATSTFEELALLFPEREPAPLSADAPAPPARAVSVAFHGPFAGRLLLRVTDEALAAAAANMLGADLPPDASTCRDALGELANVICGNLLPALAGREEIFRLAAPATADPAGADHAALPLAAAVHLGLDAGRADVLLFLDPVA